MLPANVCRTTRLAIWLLLCALSTVPVLAQVPPSGDTYVSNSFAKTNFGSGISLVVAPGTNSFVQFNLSGIPAGASINKASLRLFVDAIGAKGSFDVYELNSSWNESLLTYNSQPGLGISATAGHPVAITASNQSQFLLIDITTLVQGWVNRTIPNNGVALALTSASGAFSFDSKESLLTGNFPELEIVFNGGNGSVGPAGPVGPQGPAGATGAQGPLGPQGSKGDSGAIGPQGATGPVGPAGPVGSVGPQGAVGAAGPQGSAGAAGVKGDPGAMGAVGPQGPAGPPGAVGPSGTAGLANFACPSGQSIVGFNGAAQPVCTASTGGGTGTGGVQDSDGDGIPDSLDPCPLAANRTFNGNSYCPASTYQINQGQYPAGTLAEVVNALVLYVSATQVTLIILPTDAGYMGEPYDSLTADLGAIPAPALGARVNAFGMVTPGPGFALAGLEVVSFDSLPLTVSHMSASAPTVTVGGEVGFTVTTTAPVPVDTLVDLQPAPAPNSDPLISYVSFPTSVLIPAGQNSGTFMVTGLAAGSAGVKAVLNGIGVTAQIVVLP